MLRYKNITLEQSGMSTASQNDLETTDRIQIDPLLPPELGIRTPETTPLDHVLTPTSQRRSCSSLLRPLLRK